MKINTNFNKIALLLALVGACSNVAFADGNAFTPLNFDDTSSSYSVPKAVPTTAAKSTSGVAKTLSKVLPDKSAAAATAATPADGIPGEVPIGNDNIQNAILELDNAQVGIRGDLLNYKAKYADIDAQYKLIKNERAMLDKQVKSIERRIKSIDKAKEKIRRNML